jgi:hypothetical protein
MAYPTIDAPYGLKPVNLIGGQTFAGSTRMIPIATGYSTGIFNGDIVQLTATGTAIISSLAISTTSQAAQAVVPGTVGVFLGCEYSPPSGPLFGKQRAQYWPAGTLAQDAVAYVFDDPDAVFRVAVLSMPAAATNTATALSTIGYMSEAFVGTNAYYVGANVGSTFTGNSTGGIVGNTAGASNGAGNVRKDNSTAAAMRIVGVVPDTAVTVTTALTAGASSTALTVASTAGVFPGMQVVIPAYTAGAGGAGQNTYVTAVTSGTAVTVSASITAASGSTVAFVGYPEMLVKFNFGYHSYYNATQIA